jgi:hypothetical protein
VSFDAGNIVLHLNRHGNDLGILHAVEIRITRDMNCMVVVNRLLTTATTRPAQSSTGEPEAP